MPFVTREGIVGSRIVCVWTVPFWCRAVRLHRPRRHVYVTGSQGGDEYWFPLEVLEYFLYYKIWMFIAVDLYFLSENKVDKKQHLVQVVG